MIATSHREILGYRDVPEEVVACDLFISRQQGLKMQGLVFIQRTMKRNLEAIVRGNSENISGMQNETVKKFTGEMFETVRNQH